MIKKKTRNLLGLRIRFPPFVLSAALHFYWNKRKNSRDHLTTRLTYHIKVWDEKATLLPKKGALSLIPSLTIDSVPGIRSIYLSTYSMIIDYCLFQASVEKVSMFGKGDTYLKYLLVWYIPVNEYHVYIFTSPISLPKFQNPTKKRCEGQADTAKYTSITTDSSLLHCLSHSFQKFSPTHSKYKILLILVVLQ